MKMLASPRPYTLDGDAVIPRKGLGPRFALNDIRSWQQVFVSIAVFDVVVVFADGSSHSFSEHGAQLIEILKQKASERELPWQAT